MTRCAYCGQPFPGNHVGDQCPPGPTVDKVLCIDPGEKALAWSAWGQRLLVDLGLARMSQGQAASLGFVAHGLAEQLPRNPDTAVVEEMVHYVQGRKDTRQAENSKTEALLRLQAIGAFCAGYVQPGHVIFTPAREWKGQVPKEITRLRVEAALSAPELEVYRVALARTPESLRHNLVDAVGLGLWHFRRK